jgi:hypothetical protein
MARARSACATIRFKIQIVRKEAAVLFRQHRPKAAGEGDTLVVDTFGLNDKTFLDNYRTPHIDKLHVTECWRLIEDGRKLEIL